MNTTVTHVVEGADLPTYESGLTDSGYLHLGGGVKVTIADRHVDYLRQLVVAAEGAIARIEARAPKPELQHPGTWLPGDQIVDTDGDTWTREDTGRWTWHRRDGRLVKAFAGDYSAEAELDAPEEGAHITHLVPRKAGA